MIDDLVLMSMKKETKHRYEPAGNGGLIVFITGAAYGFY